ncbi:P-loop containing nucleoside triphosphate hydrolase protein [Meira miltonrushii]|uniref:P-loop containing nucleoside triphosphate hydrolase protein n=1 Tax=Meira miltonrushii TaxID=1280837 RepID=A0A316V613_9BASI|nr:P-loop containing nucleoside triphosphate hydrolase protein [Meira miltonrushii]PWN33029.1 P-loop containing nucleoside triphosphate hydrolase protein [Meira miltonrushii]
MDAVEQGDADPNLPLLIVGPSGSGKTFELTVQAIREINIRLNAQNGDDHTHMKALCMTPFNTATSHLMAKFAKGLDVVIAEGNLVLAQQRPPIVDPVCTTIHHTCRKWLAAYGHLIDQPNMAEVCSEERAKRLLELLQSLEHNDEFYERNQDIWNQDIERVRIEMVEELTLGVRSFEFLESAILAARTCKNDGAFALTLQEIIRLYKINDFRLVDDIFARFTEAQIFAAIDFFPWYDEILRHNRLYDFEDLVIFGLRLVNMHARHITKAEKIGLIVIDDFQNSSEQQRRFLKALMSAEGNPIKLMVACNDHHIAQTEGGRLEDLDRTAYAFTGAPISFSPDELMAGVLPVGALYQHVDYRINWRSSSNIQQVAYGIFNRHLLNFNREGLQYQPVAVGSHSIAAEARFIQEEVDRIHLEDRGRGESLSSVSRATIPLYTFTALTFLHPTGGNYDKNECQCSFFS